MTINGIFLYLVLTYILWFSLSIQVPQPNKIEMIEKTIIWLIIFFAGWSTINGEWKDILFTFIGVVFALWYENLGKPRLIISKGYTTDNDSQPMGRRKFLHLNVSNQPRKNIPFIPRNTAKACHGTITFLSTEHKIICGPMAFKWDGTPEPIKHEIGEGNQLIPLIDNRLVRISQFIDIQPDETESLAIAIRIFNEDVAYGWNPNSYFYKWRHPDYQLSNGEFIARIKIKYATGSICKDFYFSNPIDFEKFDLL